MLRCVLRTDTGATLSFFKPRESPGSMVGEDRQKISVERDDQVGDDLTAVFLLSLIFSKGMVKRALK